MVSSYYPSLIQNSPFYKNGRTEYLTTIIGLLIFLNCNRKNHEKFEFDGTILTLELRKIKTCLNQRKSYSLRVDGLTLIIEKLRFLIIVVENRDKKEEKTVSLKQTIVTHEHKNWLKLNSISATKNKLNIYNINIYF